MNIVRVQAVQNDALMWQYDNWFNLSSILEDVPPTIIRYSTNDDRKGIHSLASEPRLRTDGLDRPVGLE